MTYGFWTRAHIPLHLILPREIMPTPVTVSLNHASNFITDRMYYQCNHIRPIWLVGLSSNDPTVILMKWCLDCKAAIHQVFLHLGHQCAQRYMHYEWSPHKVRSQVSLQLWWSDRGSLRSAQLEVEPRLINSLLGLASSIYTQNWTSVGHYCPSRNPPPATLPLASLCHP